jgi:Uma2 family endonuclease
MITEDNTPVDSIYAEKQQRLLPQVLYTSWRGPGEGRTFMALTNVGLFYSTEKPAIVPDHLLSLDRSPPSDPLPKSNRSYFIWKYGKPPELVIEVVSNLYGEEDGTKFRLYASIGVTYYVIWDVENQLAKGQLRAFTRRDGAYEPLPELWFPAIGLGLTIWHGVFEGWEADWLRWVDPEGNLLLTGEEQRQRAEQAAQLAEQEKQRAEQEKQRAERLAARLRELGIEEA